MAKMASEDLIANTDTSEFDYGIRVERERTIKAIRNALGNPALETMSAKMALNLLIISLKMEE